MSCTLVPTFSRAILCLLFFVIGRQWLGIPFCEDPFTTDRRVLSLLASIASIRRGGVIRVVGVSHTLLTRSRGYLGTATATADSHSCHRSSVAIDLFPCMLPILSHASDVESYVRRRRMGSSALLLKTTSDLHTRSQSHFYGSWSYGWIRDQ
jgi:hypothetical protein